ncbi:alpha/beta fold hydrolase [Streptomyces sp. HPF1205]|uniref:alpha/beta fold hydrolase n=1 Tax=Streptomyces sp. HPF1205 TaxID=2873262 RepID=UPI001CEE03FA|nr:alpha/beta hydrolase [Streptomyces sp. HPF1205]
MPDLTAPDGTRLRYHLRGRGEPLVVLPGGPMRASEYLGDLGGLTGHRRLVLLDLRGTGGSQVPARDDSYRCDRQVGDVGALLARLGPGPADLLAHSAGANLAVLYAAAHPERVRRLVLVTPNLSALGLATTGEQRRRAAAARAGEPWHPAAARALERILARGGEGTDEDWDAVTPLYYGRWDARAERHAAAEVAQTNEPAARAYQPAAAFDPARTKAALARLAAPVLVLAGELDPGPRPETAAEGARLFPGGRLVVQPGAGHYPWLDDPRSFTSAVAGFLDGRRQSLRATAP